MCWGGEWDAGGRGGSGMQGWVCGKRVEFGRGALTVRGAAGWGGQKGGWGRWDSLARRAEFCFGEIVPPVDLNAARPAFTARAARLGVALGARLAADARQRDEVEVLGGEGGGVGSLGQHLDGQLKRLRQGDDFLLG